MIESSRLSVSICRMMRVRLAPIAVRIATSFSREAAPGEEEIRHVRAGNQQNERDRAQQHEQATDWTALNEAILQKRQIRVPTFVGFGILPWRAAR